MGMCHDLSKEAMPLHKEHRLWFQNDVKLKDLDVYTLYLEALLPVYEALEEYKMGDMNLYRVTQLKSDIAKARQTVKTEAVATERFGQMVKEIEGRRGVSGLKGLCYMFFGAPAMGGKRTKTDFEASKQDPWQHLTQFYTYETNAQQAFGKLTAQYDGDTSISRVNFIAGGLEAFTILKEIREAITPKSA